MAFLILGTELNKMQNMRDYVMNEIELSYNFSMLLNDVWN